MKKRKIPSKEKVMSILKRSVSSRLKVNSQQELSRLVLKQLIKYDKKYTITPLRARRIALSIPEIEVKAKTKKSSGLKKVNKCPICESSIKPFKVKNLMDKKIVVGYECTSCKYQSDLEAFMPMKYVFIWKP